MTNKTIYTVNIHNTHGEIIYSSEFYNEREARAFQFRGIREMLDARVKEYTPQEASVDNIFNQHKFTITTTYFNGYFLPEEDKKLLIELIEADAGAFVYSEASWEKGSKIFVDVALGHAFGDDEDEQLETTHAQKQILQGASDAGIDVITFER